MAQTKELHQRFIALHPIHLSFWLGGVVAGFIALFLLTIFASFAVRDLHDLSRVSDLKKIQGALERYKQVNGRYPFSTRDFNIEGATWGKTWDPYLGQLPKDPSPGLEYAYVSDSQSYQLYAWFEERSPFSASYFCPSSCGPAGVYNAGLSSPGSSLIAFELPRRISGLASGSQSFTIETTQLPKLVSFLIDPFNPKVGEKQAFGLSIKGTSPVKSASVTVRLDNGGQTYRLSLTSGNRMDGVWSASWKLADTHLVYYSFIIEAEDAAGNVARVVPNFGNIESTGALLLGNR